MKTFYTFCAFYFTCVPLGYVYFVWPMRFTSQTKFDVITFSACAFTLMLLYLIAVCVYSKMQDMCKEKKDAIRKSVKNRLRNFIRLMSKRDDIIEFDEYCFLEDRLVSFYAHSVKYEGNCGFIVSIGVDNYTNELKVRWYDRRFNAENVELNDFLVILDYLLNVAFISDCGIEKVNFNGVTKKILDACSVLEPVRYTICNNNAYSLMWERKSWDIENGFTVESH